MPLPITAMSIAGPSGLALAGGRASNPDASVMRRSGALMDEWQLRLYVPARLLDSVACGRHDLMLRALRMKKHAHRPQTHDHRRQTGRAAFALAVDRDPGTSARTRAHQRGIERMAQGG